MSKLLMTVLLGAFLVFPVLSQVVSADSATPSATPTIRPTLLSQVGGTGSGIIKGELRLAQGFAADFGTFFSSLLSIVIAVAAVLVFFELVYGAFSWIVSGGDKGKTQAAQSRLIAAVVGLIIIAASYAILLILVQFLGFSSLSEMFRATQPLSTGQFSEGTPR